MSQYFSGFVCHLAARHSNSGLECHAYTRKHRHLSSETYEIVAQSGQKRFFVHSDILIAKCSSFLGNRRKAYLDERSQTPTDDTSCMTPISQHSVDHLDPESVQDASDASLTGPWNKSISATAGSESRERKIDLLQWDGDTVGRFVEFLYIGHYQAPSPRQLVTEQESIISEDDTYRRDVYTPETARSEVTETQSDGTASPVGPHRPLTPLSGFDEEPDLGRNAFREREAEVFSLRFFNSAICDYNDVLLAHARVYALAQHLKFEALQKVSLQRLLSALLSIDSVKPESQVVLNVIDLLRYVYSHTASSTASEEPIRKIVSQFAALNFPALQSRGEMSELIKEGGELASDLMEKVWKRLVNSEDSLHSTRVELSRLEDATDNFKFQREKTTQLEEKIRKLEGTTQAQNLTIHAMKESAEDAKLLLSIEERARELTKKELNSFKRHKPSIWEAHVDRWGYRISLSDIFWLLVLLLGFCNVGSNTVPTVNDASGQPHKTPKISSYRPPPIKAAPPIKTAKRGWKF